ncbi:hypothetical protein BOX15_Mlig017330g1, partial [Macrostomum lignano]
QSANSRANSMSADTEAATPAQDSMPSSLVLVDKSLTEDGNGNPMDSGLSEEAAVNSDRNSILEFEKPNFELRDDNPIVGEAAASAGMDNPDEAEVGLDVGEGKVAVSDKPQVDGAGSDEARVDEAGSDKPPVDGAGSDEARVDETESDEAQVDEAESDKPQVDGAGSDEAQVDEAEFDEAQVDEAAESGEARLDEAGSDEAQVSEAGSDEAQVAEAGSDQAQVAEAGFDEAQVAEAESGEARVDEAGSDEDQVAEAGSDEAQVAEAGSDEDQVAEAQSGGAQVNEAGSDEARVEETESDRAQVDEAESDRAQVDEAESDRAHVDEAHAHDFTEAEIELQGDEKVTASSYAPVQEMLATIESEQQGNQQQLFNESNPELIKRAPSDSAPETEATPELNKPVKADLEQNDEATSSEIQSSGIVESVEPEPKPANEEYIDILGNGQLLKKTIEKGGDESTRPKTGCRVTLNYEARLGGPDGPVVDKLDGLIVAIGDYDFLQAFDIALMLVGLGERCEIRSGPQHAYGSKHAYTTRLGAEIPPNSTLTFTVDLLKVDQPLDLGSVSLDNVLVMADAKRERGNFWFNRDEAYTAVCCYARAAAMLEQRCSANLSGASNELVQTAMDARVRVYNNLAACQLKMEAWNAAIESCDKALRLQAGNAKALYRKGRGLIGKGEPAAALQAMRAALSEEPDSRALQNEVAKLTIECRRQQTASQDLYRRMMGVGKSPGTATSSTSNSPSSMETSTRSGSSNAGSFIGRYKYWLVGAIGSVVVSALLAGAAYRNNR